MKKILFIFAIFVASSQLSAQNDFRISHFMMNELSYNPAFAGNCPDLQATLWVREQWTGFSNAPSTQTLTGQTYLPKYGGVGVAIMNDRLGFEKNLHFKAQYAFRYRIDKQNLLAIGTGLGFQNKNLDGTKLIYDEPNDPNGIFTSTNHFAPTMDFGVQYIYKDLTGGISYSHVLRGKKVLIFLLIQDTFFCMAVINTKQLKRSM
ncbi:MAG: PorP/SprF family type IX secretion system membrane protein [Bacteroidota bacterium]